MTPDRVPATAKTLLITFPRNIVPAPAAVRGVMLDLARAKVSADFVNNASGVALRFGGSYVLVVNDDETAKRAREFLTEKCKATVASCQFRI